MAHKDQVVKVTGIIRLKPEPGDHYTFRELIIPRCTEKRHESTETRIGLFEDDQLSQSEPDGHRPDPAGLRSLTASFRAHRKGDREVAIPVVVIGILRLGEDLAGQRVRAMGSKVDASRKPNYNAEIIFLSIKPI